MKNTLTIIFNKLKTLLTVVYNFLLDYFQEERKNIQKQQKIIQQQGIRQKYYNFIIELRNELYEVFKLHLYPPLIKIEIQQHLRIVDFKKKVYIYSISKRTSERIPLIVLEKIKQNMNIDLQTFVNEIIRMYGQDYLQYWFPILANGVYINAVLDKETDVWIMVYANLSP